MSKAFPYGKATGAGAGNAVLDAGSLQADRAEGPRASAASAHPRWSSNFLLVGAKRSTTGHPLFVGGPQIGYTYPGLTLEADISWPGGQARGATAPGFAGNILIGRGQDYAWSLTSAGSDLIDTFVGDAVRRLAHEVPLQGPLPRRWAASTPARSRAPAGSSTARPSTAR